MLLLGAGAVWADTLSPDEKLAAIRKGLVQAALEGPTEVSTTQWIDGNGALQELSAFRSGMKVRGVRVLGYSADGQGDPMAKLQWQDAEGPESAPKGKKTALCKAPLLGRLQHVLGWSWISNSAWSADNAPLIDALQSSVFAQLQLAGAAKAQWRLVERAPSASRSSYQQALLGSSQDDLPWQLQFQLVAGVSKPAPAGISPVAPAIAVPSEKMAAPRFMSEPPTTVVQVRMTLTGRNQSRPALQSDVTLKLSGTEDNWGTPSLSAAARDLVAQQAQTWGQALQNHLGCQAVLADVTQATGAQVRINVGNAAGVRVGDDWVLAHDQSGVQRALEPGASAQTVLAKVQSVGEYYALLRPVSGSTQNVKTTWTAWSADAAH
jgi:hypothetical protein